MDLTKTIMTSKFFISLLVGLCYYINQAENVAVVPVNQWSVLVNSEKAFAPGVSGIYTIGRQLGFVLANMYYLNEDSKIKWMAYEYWNFTHTFNGNDLLAYENVNLVLDGIDTFALVQLNKANVTFTENMFRQYVLDVKKYLNPTNNSLKIDILSPLNYAQKQSLQYKYVIPPECPDKAYNGDCHVNKIRKMQASFSWDWGPSIPSMGIWKPVYFEGFNETVIRHVVVDTEQNGNRWQVNVDVYFENNKKNSVTGTLQLTTQFNSVKHSVNLAPNSNGEIVYSTSFLVDERNVKMWWPNGYGEQNLYNLTATFTSARQEVSSKTVRIGFKTVELVQEKIGNNGLSFYFKINKVPIFAKGSNLIPIHLVPEKGQDPDVIKKLFSAAKSAHMNMLRIWGGGVYESESLYDLADEYGILIWQDFMFACALYPSDAAFLDNVVKEVRYQVKRLRSHPSIILYSGNNENEGALVDNWWGITNKTKYAEDYVKLYVQTIKTEFDRLTHSRGIYVTSSPSNGRQTEIEGYLSKQPGSSYYGDVHFYDYSSDSFSPSTYPIPRFASEYGLQSLPSEDSFLKDTHDDKDLNIESSFMIYRQHHPSGNGLLLEMIQKQLTLPKETDAKYNLAVIYYSQIIQAYSYKIQTEHYRNYRSILTTDGRGHTMGALYWQLNDVWAAPTWSSIDFYGRWKMLQYFAVNFFSPILVSGHLDQNNVLNIYVATDHASVYQRIFVRYYKWGTVTPVSSFDVIANVPSGTSKLIYTISDLSANLRSHGCLPTTCFLTLSVVGAPDNFVLPAKLKDSTVNSANVQITSVVQNGAAFDIRVASDNVALFVWLDAHSITGHFSENGFLQIGASRIVKFYPDDSTVTLKEIQEALTITHLKDPKLFSA